MHETIIYTLCGILGVCAHSLMKYNDLKTKATAANVKFSFATYLSQDWVGIALSFVAIGLWLMLFQQAAEKYPAIKNYTRGSFILCGFFGSYLIQYFASKAQTKLTNIIDIKTTELDQTKAPVTNINSSTVKP